MTLPIEQLMETRDGEERPQRDAVDEEGNSDEIGTAG